MIKFGRIVGETVFYRIKRYVFLFVMLVCFCAFCGNREVYRDSRGRTSVTATKVGNRTIYRDSSGRTIGSSSQVGNRTIYRDSSGRTSVTGTPVGNRTIYRDSSGRTIGSKQ